MDWELDPREDDPDACRPRLSRSRGGSCRVGSYRSESMSSLPAVPYMALYAPHNPLRTSHNRVSVGATAGRRRRHHRAPHLLQQALDEDSLSTATSEYFPLTKIPFHFVEGSCYVSARRALPVSGLISSGGESSLVATSR